MNLLAYFFISLILVISPWVRAHASETKVYWGYVSPGSGTGILGHGFLLFKQSDDSFFSGDVYQYEVTTDIKPRDFFSKRKMTTIKMTTPIEFSLKIQKFSSVFEDYIDDQDRSISLYELNLNQNEIVRLLNLLHADFINHSFSQQFSYGPNNNCVSRLVDLINQVITPERRIEYWGSNSPVYSDSRGFGKMISDPFLNRFPFYIAATLEHHPLSKGLVKRYDGKTIYQAQFLAAIFEKIKMTVIICHWSDATQKTLERYYGFLFKSKERLALKPVLTLASTCPQSKKLLVGSLLDLYEGLTPDRVQARKDLYKAVNDLLYKKRDGLP